MPGLSLELIEEASAFLAPRIRHTPVELSAPLTAILGVETLLKLEFLQITGSFKFRGAWFRTARARREGLDAIATCSAGNHGKGIAYAAKQEGLRAVVFVPRDVDDAKFRGMIALGADVRRSEFPGYDDTEAWARSCAAAEGIPFVSAFDDYDVMAGNGGSLAVETAAQVGDEPVDWIVPVGGGGMAAGLAFWVKLQRPSDRVIGCQLKASPALAMSLERGHAVTQLPVVETVASGVEGGIGKLTFAVIRSRVDHVALVEEQEVKDATRWMLREHQYLIEPTAAVPLAACLGGEVGKLNRRAVVVVSARNVSESTARSILAAR